MASVSISDWEESSGSPATSSSARYSSIRAAVKKTLALTPFPRAFMRMSYQKQSARVQRYIADVALPVCQHVGLQPARLFSNGLDMVQGVLNMLGSRDERGGILIVGHGIS